MSGMTQERIEELRQPGKFLNPGELNVLLDDAETLRDIEDIHLEVIGEKCPADEVHCGCVRIYRKELARLREVIEILTPSWEWNWGDSEEKLTEIEGYDTKKRNSERSS